MTELVIPGLLLTAVGVLLFFRLEVRRQRALAAVALTRLRPVRGLIRPR